MTRQKHVQYRGHAQRWGQEDGNSLAVRAVFNQEAGDASPWSGKRVSDGSHCRDVP